MPSLSSPGEPAARWPIHLLLIFRPPLDLAHLHIAPIRDGRLRNGAFSPPCIADVAHTLFTMSSGDKVLGVTPPISSNLPTPAEIESNNALVDELRKQGIFEAKADTEKR